jgi:prepilin peptidase CpaA
MLDATFTQISLETVLALLLIVAAAIDVRTFTISNRLNLAVAGLAPFYWLATGLSLWPGIPIQLGVATAVFILFAAFFYAGMMGGGDVKLAAALALWFPPAATIQFIVLMSLAGGVLTIGLVVWHRAKRREGRPEIPYGVAIAVGGLAILAQPFCLMSEAVQKARLGEATAPWM